MRTISAKPFEGLHDQTAVMDAIKQELDNIPANEKAQLSHEASEVLGHIASALPNIVSNKIAEHNAHCHLEVVF